TAENVPQTAPTRIATPAKTGTATKLIMASSSVSISGPGITTVINTATIAMPIRLASTRDPVSRIWTRTRNGPVCSSPGPRSHEPNGVVRGSQRWVGIEVPSDVLRGAYARTLPVGDDCERAPGHDRDTSFSLDRRA